jgi:hypothetical protein
MKSISFKTFSENALNAFRRFPFAIVFAIATAVTALLWVHYDDAASRTETWDHDRLVYAWYIMTFYLAMLLSVSIAFFSERFGFSQVRTIVAYAIGIGLCAWFFFSLDSNSETTNGGRFALYVIALHLLVSISAFMVRNEMNGFWQFNKSLFLRFLLSGLYSAVIFAGLALAMVAVNELFDINIKDVYYFDLWVIVAGVFNTWFFLSGLPADVTALQHRHDYPKGLKIFTVNVLLPLVTLYMVILYLYMFKIVITSHWPAGWVGYLVIAFSVFGILSFLLIYPLREQESNRWINTFMRLFYFLILPLIAMLVVAIYKRASEYGITENRYYLILLAAWLVFIAVYSIATRSRNIRTIPLSLAVIAALSSAGPWSAFNVARNSQIQQLTQLLEENKILIDGKVDTLTKHSMDAKDKIRVEDIVYYLVSVHGYESMQPLFTQDLSKVVSSHDKYGWNRKREIVELMKIDENSEVGTRSLNNDGNGILMPTKGYDYASSFYFGRGEMQFSFGEKDVHVLYHREDKYFEVTIPDAEPIRLNADSLIQQVVSSKQDFIIDDRYAVTAENDKWKAKIVFSSIDIDSVDGALRISGGSGFLMISVKE